MKKQYQRELDWKRRNPTGYRRSRRKITLKKYGLTNESYDAILQTQKGKCAICGDVPETFLDVDHDHLTGRVRGLLCRLCNRGLGQFKDDPVRVRAALAYLEK